MHCFCWRCYSFLISNFRRVLNVVCFLLGNSPASEFCMPTFRNTLFHLHRRIGGLHVGHCSPTCSVTGPTPILVTLLLAQAIFEPILFSLWVPLLFLTLILLTWKIRWAPNNASKWQMGYNSAFKGLNIVILHLSAYEDGTVFRNVGI